MPSTTELTTFAESTPEIVATAGHSDALHAMGNPYPNPEITKILSRKYKIADVSWADTDIDGAELDNVDLMRAILAIPNIADKLTQFRWLRADMEVEVRLNATPFHIGAVMVSYIPRTQADAAVGTLWESKNRSLTQKSQNHGMVMSASSKNNLTFTVQREAATIFDPIDEVGSYFGALGTLNLTVLNKIVLAGGGSANPINIAVFASFIEPKVSGYGYFPILNPPRPKVVPHSLDVTGEAMQRVNAAITGPEATSLFSPSVITGAMDSLSSLVKSVAPVAQFAMSLGLSKPNNLSTLVPATIDDFRDLNYGHGVAQATKLSLHPGAGLGAASMNDLKKHSISSFIQKPSYLTTVTIDKTTVVDSPILHFPVHPSLSNYETTTYSPTPLAYASQSFKWWRGGMKLRFEFISSQFVTARIRITHWPAPTLPASLEEYAGDAVSTVVDIRGDTMCDFTVPYVSPFPYQPCRGYLHSNSSAGWSALPAEEQNSFITLSLVNSMQQPDFAGTAVIYVNVYSAAAEDFVFGGLIHPYIRTPLNTGADRLRVEPHSLDVHFAKPFKPLVQAFGTYEAGLILPEQYSGVEEILMKYGFNPVDATEGEIYPVIAIYDARPGGGTQKESHIHYWAQCFRWNRGGLRYKLIPTPDPASTTSRYVTMTQKAEVLSFPDFSIVQDRDVRSVIEFEIPWCLPTYANSYWNAIDQDTLVNIPPYDYAIVDILPTDIPTPNAYVAVADDYVFGHQLAIPTHDYVYVPPAREMVPAQLKQAKLSAPTPQIYLGLQPPELDQSFGLPDAVREKLTKYLLLKEKGNGKSVTSSSQ